jgi:hypothetical protein
VQLAAGGRDLAGGIGDLLLSPPVEGREQQREQRCRGRDQHALGDAVFEQGRLGFQSRVENGGGIGGDRDANPVAATLWARSQIGQKRWAWRCARAHCACLRRDSAGRA